MVRTRPRSPLAPATLALAAALVPLALACSPGSQTPGPARIAPAAAPAAPPARYDAVPLIPRQVLFSDPEHAAPLLSPDGTLLAYLAPDQGVLNVWVRTVGQRDDRPITQARGRGIRSHAWAADSAHVLYLQDADGDENWHVYAAPAAGGQARDLTPIPGVNARIIAVEHDRPGDILVGLNDRDPRFHDVYKIHLATGERTLVQTNDLGAIDWIADHTLTVRVAAVPLADGGITFLHRRDARARFSELLSLEPDDALASTIVGFAADNRTLHIKTSTRANTIELRRLDVVTRKQTTLAADTTADVSMLLVHPRTHAPQAAAFVRARTEWKVLDPAIEADIAALERIHSGDLSVLSRDRADTTWIVSFQSDTQPTRYHVYDRATRQARFLFSARPALDDQPLAEMKPVAYRARDGLEIHGYLTTPVGVEAHHLPAVILPHGGPWARDTWGFHPVPQLLANRGYAVLQPNFRGSTGYGKRFLNAADREWGGKMQDDITDGTRWLIDQGIADPARVCIMGGSYGGYATLMGLAREPELYRCGVNIVGVANLITWLATIPPYWKPLLPMLYRRVGNPRTDAAFLQSRSPVFLADRIQAPLLIAQGANDPRVPRAESTQIRDALQQLGRDVEYIEYPDEGHGFARPENRLAFFARAERFLAHHLGGRYQP